MAQAYVYIAMQKYMPPTDLIQNIADKYNLNRAIINEVVNLFNRFDKNKDGFITQKELSEAANLVQAGLSNSHEGELTELIEEIDQNYDGKIQFTEFCSVIVPYIDVVFAEPCFSDLKNNGRNGSQGWSGRPGAQQKVLKKQNSLAHYNTSMVDLFNVFDQNHDGYITKDELLHVMNALGESINEEDADLMLNGNVRISIVQFNEIILSLEKQYTNSSNGSASSQNASATSKPQSNSLLTIVEAPEKSIANSSHGSQQRNINHNNNSLSKQGGRSMFKRLQSRLLKWCGLDERSV